MAQKKKKRANKGKPHSSERTHPHHPKMLTPQAHPITSKFYLGLSVFLFIPMLLGYYLVMYRTFNASPARIARSVSKNSQMISDTGSGLVIAVAGLALAIFAITKVIKKMRAKEDHLWQQVTALVLLGASSIVTVFVIIPRGMRTILTSPILVEAVLGWITGIVLAIILTSITVWVQRNMKDRRERKSHNKK